MNGYFRDYGPEQREMVERWLGRMRKRFAGARDASDVGREGHGWVDSAPPAR